MQNKILGSLDCLSRAGAIRHSANFSFNKEAYDKLTKKYFPKDGHYEIVFMPFADPNLLGWYSPEEDVMYINLFAHLNQVLLTEQTLGLDVPEKVKSSLVNTILHETVHAYTHNNSPFLINIDWWIFRYVVSPIIFVTPIAVLFAFVTWLLANPVLVTTVNNFLKNGDYALALAISLLVFALYKMIDYTFKLSSIATKAWLVVSRHYTYDERNARKVSKSMHGIDEWHQIVSIEKKSFGPEI